MRDTGPSRAASRVRAGLAAVVLTALLAVLGGCATSYDSRGVTHRVRSGESIQRIARIYGTDVQRIAEYNNILNPDEIQPGMKIYIPPRQKRASFKRLPFGEPVGSGETVAQDEGKGKGRERQAKQGSSDEFSRPIQLYRGRFIWPVEGGRVSSVYGMRDGRKHDGIDISAPQGTPLHAAAAGKVVFAGSMRGYGNLIVVRHKDDLFTAYSHNSSNGVRKGAVVKQGEVIGRVGRTGRASGPHLHFEIRHGQTSRNPLFFLPDRGADDEGRAIRVAAKREAPVASSSPADRKKKAAPAKKEVKGAKGTKVAKSSGPSSQKKKLPATTTKKGSRDGAPVQKTHSGH